MLGLWMLATCCLLPQGDTNLGASGRRELRELLTTALFAPDDESRSRAVGDAEEFSRFRMKGVVAAVRKGPILSEGASAARSGETLEQFGRTTAGYTFTVDGHDYRYAVNLPRKYDVKKSWPLLLDPGHGSAAKSPAKGKAELLEFYRSLADGARKKDWIVVRTEIIEQVGAGGLFEDKPEDEIVRIFDAFFRDVFSRFRIDLSEIRVAGISQTGYWAWYLGAARPCRYAGIVPGAAVTWQVDPWIENLRNLAVCVVHGEIDPKCPVSQPRAAVRRLARVNDKLEYIEVAGAGHDGRVFGRVGDGLEFTAKHARDPYPKRVSKALGNLQDGGWAYWLRVDELKDEDDGKTKWGRKVAGGVDAEIDGQTIRLYSEGIERITLGLSSEMLDLDSDIEVIWNGKSVFSGRAERSVQTLIELAVAKADWLGTFEAKLELR